jgi:hypothetical protein
MTITRRHNAAVKAEAIKDALRVQHLIRPAAITAAYAAAIRAAAFLAGGVPSWVEQGYGNRRVPN